MLRAAIESYANETNDSVEKIQSFLKDLRLPPQPTIVVALSKELTTPDPDFRKIATLLNQDPALVSRVLKIINSPLFGAKREVTSILTALSLMGIRNFYSMVVTSAAKEALGFNDGEAERLWKHSVHVAVLSEKIAKHCQDVLPEEAYMVGLFHDCAIPILITKFPLYQEIVEKVVVRGGDIHDFEENKFNTHHAIVGAVLASSWGLPPRIYKAIRFHHSDTLGVHTDPTTHRLAAVLTLADYLSRSIESGENNEDCDSPRWLKLLGEIQTTLNLGAESLERLYDEASQLPRAPV